MTTRYVHVEPGPSPSAEAIDAVRAHVKETDAQVYNVYAVDSEHRLTGITPLKDLLVAPDPNAQALDHLDRSTSSRSTRRWTRKRSRAAWRNTTSTPCPSSTPTSSVLLGICTIDDIVDVLTQEQTEGHPSASAPSSRSTCRTSPPPSARSSRSGSSGWSSSSSRSSARRRRCATTSRSWRRSSGALIYVPAAHLRGRQLRLAVLDPDHPRPHHRRDPGEGTGGASSCARRPWAWCSVSSSRSSPSAACSCTPISRWPSPRRSRSPSPSSSWPAAPSARCSPSS